VVGVSLKPKASIRVKFQKNKADNVLALFDGPGRDGEAMKALVLFIR
jgi:hypothetical protein